MPDHADLIREIELHRAELARRKLIAFTQYLNDRYQPNWHHLRIAAELDRVLTGETKRLMLFMPPQHGKTELASRNLVPFALGHDPDMQIVFWTYNAERAKEVSGDVQKLMLSAEYRALFPAVRLGSDKDEETRTAQKFQVVGRRGVYQAAGVGQGISGKSMMLGIIDDPIRGRADAESDTIRNGVWSSYVADFKSRQMSSDARIVLIQTRWHTDDLAGRLLKLAAENPQVAELQWRVVSFPAVCTDVRMDDPRQLDEALWPTRFSRSWLDAERITSGTYDWSALYQQTPVPPGGALAQRAWFRIVDVIPSGIKRRCRFWDLAATKEAPGKDPSWTVGTLLAEHFDGQWTILHIVRVRETPARVDALMKQTALADGRDVLVREFLDPGAAGKSVINSHSLMLTGWDYDSLPATGAKETRWRPFFVQAEAGRVNLLRGQWNTAWLDEVSMVPYWDHEDQADSVAGAFVTLTAHVDKGPSAAVIMPGVSTVSGPGVGDWRAQFFRR